MDPRVLFDITGMNPDAEETLYFLMDYKMKTDAERNKTALVTNDLERLIRQNANVQ